MATITAKDFIPLNQWVPVCVKTTCYRMGVSEGEIQYVPCEEVSRVWDQDASTGRRYWNQAPWVLRAKCFALAATGWPLLNHVVRCARRVFDILTFQKFAGGGSFRGRLVACVKDLLKIAVTPILLAFLELAAIYGIFNPSDGRKLFASMERLAVHALGMEIMDFLGRENPYTAPCFQPNARCHALGGDINDGDAL